jgi:glycine cleavage system protein P-like pyridoxal-binding family
LGREGQAGAAPPPAHAATQRMAARLASADGKDRYRWRKAIVEPVMGWIKEVLGFRRVSLRGEANARGEWNIVCLAVNLKRFHRIRMA